VPDIDGPASESLIACQPKAALTWSSSNHSSRYWRAEVAKVQSASSTSPRCFAPWMPNRAALSRSLGFFDARSGGDPGEVVLEGPDLGGVVGGETADLGGQRLRILVHHQVLAVVEEVQGRARRVDRQAALVEAHVAPDRAAQHAQHVGAAGAVEAGGELLGDAGAADDVAPLEHQRAHPRSRQVEGGDEAVVATADDDRAVPGRAVRARVVRPAAHAAVPSDFIRVTA
jgi:hypothetical protein